MMVRTRCAACSRWPSSTATRARRATTSRRRTRRRERRWRSSASCRRTCWKARAARASRHRSRGGRTSPGTPPAAPAIEPMRRLPRMAQPMVRRAMRVLAHDGIAPISHSTRFVALEQADFQRLEHAGYLKGLYSLLKGKGSLETWASQCAALRDDVIGLAQRRVLPQARAYPSVCSTCNWPSRPLAQGRPSCAGATSTVPPWAWRCGRPCWPTPRRRPR